MKNPTPLCCTHPAAAAATVALTLLCTSCAEPGAPLPDTLVTRFGEAEVTGSPDVEREFPELRWRFTDDSPLPGNNEDGEPQPTAEVFSAFHHISDLRVEGGKLTGRVSGAQPVLRLDIAEDLLPQDLLHKVELRLAIERGSELHVDLMRRPPELDDVLEQLADTAIGDLNIDLRPSEDGELEQQTYALGEAQASFGLSQSLTQLRSLLIRFSGAEGARFEIDWVRVAGRVEELSKLPAGFGWHGLNHVFRETVVSRSPERIAWTVELDPATEPWLDLAVGSPDDPAVTFEVVATDPSGTAVRRRRSVTEKERWFPLELDLSGLEGTARIELALDAEEPGQLGFWGGLTVRHRSTQPVAAPASAARQALTDRPPPRGVVLVVADTLRSDHLDAWGYERETAPHLTQLAAQGTRFADNISQGTWTKVAVPSILTSLYASTHGISDVIHRLPASVTTMAEAFREAGYATFHTSSVPFSGKNSNLQQGVEVLHERSSLDLGEYGSKTARPYVDEFLAWLETHQGEPFFAFVHVFDPHSPFRPRPPYDRRWMSDEDHASLREDYEALKDKTDFHGLPDAKHLDELGLDHAEYVRRAHAWYDGSIRGMDAEIGRLREALAQHVGEDVLLAVVADHGEEFLEHGRSWHGQSTYGEMVNVPMLLHWPGVVPAHVVEQTTESIDLMPTMLELARVALPPEAQGDALTPLLAAAATGANPREFGWTQRPAFTQLADAESEGVEELPVSFTVVHEGWKLIWNELVRDERPEFELFDHANDPLNLRNVADENPERVTELKKLLDSWRAMAEAARVEEANLEEMDPEELERLRALGYVN